MVLSYSKVTITEGICFPGRAQVIIRFPEAALQIPIQQKDQLLRLFRLMEPLPVKIGVAETSEIQDGDWVTTAGFTPEI